MYINHFGVNQPNKRLGISKYDLHTFLNAYVTEKHASQYLWNANRYRSPESLIDFVRVNIRIYSYKCVCVIELTILKDNYLLKQYTTISIYKCCVCACCCLFSSFFLSFILSKLNSIILLKKKNNLKKLL